MQYKELLLIEQRFPKHGGGGGGGGGVGGSGGGELRDKEVLPWSGEM